MEIESAVSLGAADLDPDALTSALEQVLPRCGYVLEWMAGAKTWKATGCGLHVSWRFCAGRGTWLDLPPAPHDRILAIALVQELNRPLLFHEALWLIDGDAGKLQVRTTEVDSDGVFHPRPTGMEDTNLEAITSGKGEVRLHQLVRHLTGTIGCCKNDKGRSFPLFEVEAIGAGPENPLRGPLEEKRLA